MSLKIRTFAARKTAPQYPSEDESVGRFHQFVLCVFSSPKTTIRECFFAISTLQNNKKHHKNQLFSKIFA